MDNSIGSGNVSVWDKKSSRFWSHWNSLLLTVHDPSLTLTQFCALLKTMLFYRAYETLSQQLSDSLRCKDHYVNLLTYLFTHMRTHTLRSSRVRRRRWFTLDKMQCRSVTYGQLHWFKHRVQSVHPMTCTGTIQLGAVHTSRCVTHNTSRICSRVLGVKTVNEDQQLNVNVKADLYATLSPLNTLNASVQRK